MLTYSILVVVLLLVLAYKSALNRLFPVGPLYLIRRDNGSSKDPFICIGFMHEVSHPWRRGKGIQVRIRSQVLQFGLCKKHPQQKEDEGVLSAIGGRYMDTDVKDIRGW
jgi:hypothetical protein